MFGKGIYFADMSSKSVNYCYAEQTDDVGLLLLCEVELGPWMHEEAEANFDAQTEMNEAGELSVLGLGRTEIWLWKDAECIHPDLKGVMLVCLTLFPTDSGHADELVYSLTSKRAPCVLGTSRDNSSTTSMSSTMLLRSV